MGQRNENANLKLYINTLNTLVNNKEFRQQNNTARKYSFSNCIVYKLDSAENQTLTKFCKLFNRSHPELDSSRASRATPTGTCEASTSFASEDFKCSVNVKLQKYWFALWTEKYQQEKNELPNSYVVNQKQNRRKLGNKVLCF